ncbi:TPA: hypothetical protein HA249_02170 [Candidatus Woesearchaeota archaeon]|nr:hypothetical protein [Candidatus Woesearchaeota archaeon]HIH47379.1 hypothetical protein [Candidatus Woesearchaeota archaeon]
MHSDITTALFGSYQPQPYCPRLDRMMGNGHRCNSDTFFIPEVYTPEVSLMGGEEEDMCLRAKIQFPHPLRIRPENEQKREDSVTYTLGDLYDLNSWVGDDRHFAQNFRGRLAERFLSLLLEGFAYQLADKACNLGYQEAEGNVVRENRGSGEDGRPQPRGHILNHTADVVIRFHRRTTLDVLVKTPEGSRRLYYYPGDVHIESTELDGLAYLHLFGRKSEKGNYAIMGEIKSGANSIHWRDLDNSRKGAPKNLSLDYRLFRPLRSIFPSGPLVYFMAGYASSFFNVHEDKRMVKGTLRRLIQTLRSANVMPVFAVVPDFIDWHQLSLQFLRHLRAYRTVMSGATRFWYDYRKEE